MHKNDLDTLVRKPGQYEAGVYQRVLAEDAGWKYLNMEARLLKKGEVWKGETGDFEYGIILLTGHYPLKN